MIDNAISGADRPPSFIPIGPKILLISLSLNPDSFNLFLFFKYNYCAVNSLNIGGIFS